MPRASDLLPSSSFELDERPIEPEPEIESVPEPYVPARDAEHRRLEQRIRDLEHENLGLHSELVHTRMSMRQAWDSYDALCDRLLSCP